MGKKTGMSKKKLEEFRQVLNNWKDILVKEALQQIEGMTEVQEIHADLTDQASAEADRDFLLRIKDRERKLILKIREALRRIDDGSFGTCELCGEQIGAERLKARPVTTQCIECKTDMEDQERRMAG
ncbi:MAG: RNA polymerase-binding protein DksA [Pseudomonadota bacterium]